MRSPFPWPWNGYSAITNSSGWRAVRPRFGGGGGGGFFLAAAAFAPPLLRLEFVTLDRGVAIPVPIVELVVLREWVDAVVDVEARRVK